MKKQNCWEVMMCGREKDNELGICPAVTEINAHTLNGGTNGGRVCLAVAGTFCEGKVQGNYAQKLMTCTTCDFRLKVKDEEVRQFKYVFFKRESA